MHNRIYKPRVLPPPFDALPRFSARYRFNLDPPDNYGCQSDHCLFVFLFFFSPVRYACSIEHQYCHVSVPAKYLVGLFFL